jgi:hypothetical protein
LISTISLSLIFTVPWLPGEALRLLTALVPPRQPLVRIELLRERQRAFLLFFLVQLLRRLPSPNVSLLVTAAAATFPRFLPGTDLLPVSVE